MLISSFSQIICHHNNQSLRLKKETLKIYMYTMSGKAMHAYGKRKEMKITGVTIWRLLGFWAFDPHHFSLTYQVLNKHCYFIAMFKKAFGKEDDVPSVPSRRKSSRRAERRRCHWLSGQSLLGHCGLLQWEGLKVGGGCWGQTPLPSEGPVSQAMGITKQIDRVSAYLQLSALEKAPCQELSGRTTLAEADLKPVRPTT